ncbi:MAG: hypothetical protein JWN60_53 [Acidobacteria bacterium]|jgi:DNA-binding Xre family transcriptional regulator|nr:hypothetical protein [Acidobacteriota bacterium]
MIKIKIKEIAKSRGIKNAHRLQIAAELSPAAAARFWKTEVEKISMETLDKLCKTLECQPGDLFVYAAGETETRQPEDATEAEDEAESFEKAEKAVETRK